MKEMVVSSCLEVTRKLSSLCKLTGTFAAVKAAFAKRTGEKKLELEKKILFFCFHVKTTHFLHVTQNRRQRNDTMPSTVQKKNNKPPGSCSECDNR